MTDKNSLVDLLTRVRAGDNDAAAALVRRYEPELRRYVRYRLTDPQLRRFLDSLDVSQSVFARLFVKLAEGRIEIVHPRQLFKLLFTMANNKLRDHVRTCRAHKRNHRLAQGEVGELLATVAEHLPDPATQVADEELVQLFRQRLSPDELALLDARMDGKSWVELAADEHRGAGVAASPEALRKKLSRAIDRTARDMELVADG